MPSYCSAGSFMHWAVVISHVWCLTPSVFVSCSWTICWTRDTRSWTLWSSSPSTTLCWSAGSAAGRSRCERESIIQDQRDDSIRFISQWFIIYHDGAFPFGREAPHSVRALNPPRRGGLIHVNRRVWGSEIMLERSEAWKHAINGDGGLKGFESILRLEGHRLNP